MNSEEIKPVITAIIDLSKFLEWVRIDLKTFMGSAIPNQY